MKNRRLEFQVVDFTASFVEVNYKPFGLPLAKAALSFFISYRLDLGGALISIDGINPFFLCDGATKSISTHIGMNAQNKTILEFPAGTQFYCKQNPNRPLPTAGDLYITAIY